MMSVVLNLFNQSPAPKSVNGDMESRGIKRKAKGDPYEEIEDDEAAQRTPTQRTRPRIPSEAPGSSAKGRLSSTSKNSKRQSRSTGARRAEIAESPRVDAAATSSALAREPEAAQSDTQPEESRNSFVPVADMGLTGPSDNTDAVPSGPSTNKSKPDRNRAEHNTKGKGKGREKATGESVTAQLPAPAPAELDEREVQEIQALLQHRMVEDGRVELLVHWAGETEKDATWEAEEEIQQGAEEMLYAYWKSQGGRINALFIKPKDAPVETYHVFKLLAHEKKPRGGFEFEVQWVGHPPTRGETSVEAESKLKKIAPDAVDQYWRDVGGRDKFLARRGRGRRQGTE
ncbi:hypothetical protein F5Y11DRAFT_231261 [Daldinia sp. FL1419]|nr:hypothetical protein F5Y11DRAFT_231261 [Daldinia sp. FL1419]